MRLPVSCVWSHPPHEVLTLACLVDSASSDGLSRIFRRGLPSVGARRGIARGHGPSTLPRSEHVVVGSRACQAGWEAGGGSASRVPRSGNGNGRRLDRRHGPATPQGAKGRPVGGVRAPWTPSSGSTQAVWTRQLGYIGRVWWSGFRESGTGETMLTMSDALGWVTIVPSYVAQYRVPLYDRLALLLSERGIALRVVHPHPKRDVRIRGDATTSPIWSELRPNLEIRLPGGSLKWRSLGKAPGAELLRIVEAAGSVMSSSWQVWRGDRRSPPTAVWGHIGNYTTDPPAMVQRALAYQVKNAAHVFAYTDRGAERAVELGALASRVTTLNNTVDLEPLRLLRSQQRSNRVPCRPSNAIYVGALEESKRISWVLDAADIAHRRVDGFRLMIVGGGPLLDRIETWSAPRPWVEVTGPLFGAELNQALLASDVILNPGRVGLLATQSLAAGVPMVTTDYRLHAPEFEYLTHNLNSEVVSDHLGSAGYGNALCELMIDPQRVQRLSQGCLETSQQLSLSDMADEFVCGIERTVGLDS